MKTRNKILKVKHNFKRKKIRFPPFYFNLLSSLVLIHLQVENQSCKKCMNETSLYLDIIEPIKANRIKQLTHFWYFKLVSGQSRKTL